MIDDAFEDFAQSLRILVEVNFRSRELLLVDAHEASGNMEQALTGVLNAFHSVYDAVREEKSIQFDWYGVAETATILSIRNARHHNISRRIRGLYNYHLQQPNPENPRSYLFVDYPEAEDGGYTFDVPISWHDMSTMLELPQAKNKLRGSAVNSISDYMTKDKIDTYSKQYGVSKEAVFFNIVPLISNSIKKINPEIRNFINPKSTEAKAYSDLHLYVEAADTKKHVVSKFKVFLPS